MVTPDDARKAADICEQNDKFVLAETLRDLASQVEAMQSQRDELLAALVESHGFVVEALSVFGDCDHSVGICNCDMKRSIDKSDSLIANAKGNAE